MDVIVIMCVGVFLGNRFRRFLPRWFKPLNERLQVGLTLALIFFMGITLGKRPGFLHELGTLGLESLAYCLLPVLFSILLVYGLTRRFMAQPKKTKGEDEA